MLQYYLSDYVHISGLVDYVVCLLSFFYNTICPIVCLLSHLFCYDNIVHLHCQSVRFHVKSWLPARSIVLECLLSKGNIDPSGEIMVLDRFCPVKS
jgi:hypothetical protein